VSEGRILGLRNPSISNNDSPIFILNALKDGQQLRDLVMDDIPKRLIPQPKIEMG
jgi:hypothetical protein